MVVLRVSGTYRLLYRSLPVELLRTHERLLPSSPPSPAAVGPYRHDNVVLRAPRVARHDCASACLRSWFCLWTCVRVTPDCGLRA